MKTYSILAISLGTIALGVGIYVASSWQDQAEDVLISTKPITYETSREVDTGLPLPPLPTTITDIKNDDSGSAEREVLWQELARLQNQIEELNSFQTSLQYSVDDILAKGSSDDTAPDSALNQDRNVEQQIERQQTAISAQLEQEDVDQEWALETERLLNEALATEALHGFELVSSSCGSTLCKVELSIDPNISPEVAMQRLAHNRSWNGPSFVKLDENGQFNIYFAREGHDLPDANIETLY